MNINIIFLGHLSIFKYNLVYWRKEGKNYFSTDFISNLIIIETYFYKV